ncbi:MAG TPA: MarR family transcriptional regulator [Terrimesophilobacter sp.]|nr:MarR family transcriptional regulator [Terrimesophilobacter sp.]
MTSEGKPFRWLDDDEQRAWRAYLAASARLQQRLDRDLQQKSGMPHAYYMILAMLSEAPDRGMRMTDLADLLSSSPSRLSHAIRKLVELGWIRRDDDPDDGRVTWACLTDDGMRVLVEAAPEHVTTVVDALFDRLTPEQVEQLREISAAMLQDRTALQD